MKNAAIIASSSGLSFQATVLHQCVCQVDHRSIQMVVSNLVNNAVKFTQTGTVTVVVGVDGLRNLVIKVTDTGCGISEEHLENIFDRYYRVPGSQPSGFGIGLAVVKEIVTLYGGSIKVKSILTKGTSFLVKIPCNAVMISGSKLKVLASSKPGITCSVQDVSDVVIVEDNSNLRELLHEVLAANHFAVSSFISAPEALAHIVSSTSTRCVLIDINMPLLNGAKFHELLKASQRDINVAFMSGYSKESATKILGFCPENFLAKPFTNAALIDMIRKLTLRGSP